MSVHRDWLDNVAEFLKLGHTPREILSEYAVQSPAPVRPPVDTPTPGRDDITDAASLAEGGVHTDEGGGPDPDDLVTAPDGEKYQKSDVIIEPLGGGWWAVTWPNGDESKVQGQSALVELGLNVPSSN